MSPKTSNLSDADVAFFGRDQRGLVVGGRVRRTHRVVKQGPTRDDVDREPVCFGMLRARALVGPGSQERQLQGKTKAHSRQRPFSISDGLSRTAISSLICARPDGNSLRTSSEHAACAHQRPVPAHTPQSHRPPRVAEDMPSPAEQSLSNFRSMVRRRRDRVSAGTLTLGIKPRADRVFPTLTVKVPPGGEIAWLQGTMLHHGDSP